MTKYPTPSDGSTGPNGAPDQFPRSPRWPTVLFIIVAALIVAYTFYAINR